MKKRWLRMLSLLLVIGCMCACDTDDEYDETETTSAENTVTTNENAEEEENVLNNISEIEEIIETENVKYEKESEQENEKIEEVEESELEFERILKTYKNGSMWVLVKEDEKDYFFLVDKNMKVVTSVDEYDMISCCRYSSDAKCYMMGSYVFDENFTPIETKLEDRSVFDSFDITEDGKIFYFETESDFEKSTNYLRVRDLNGNLCGEVEWEANDIEYGIEAIKMSEDIYLVVAKDIRYMNSYDIVYLKPSPHISFDEDKSFYFGSYKSCLINLATGEKINLSNWEDNSEEECDFEIVFDEQGNMVWNYEYYSPDCLKYELSEKAENINYDIIHSKGDLVAQLNERRYTDFINNQFINIEYNSNYSLSSVNGYKIPYSDNENISVMSIFAWNDLGEYCLELRGADSKIYFTYVDTNGNMKREPEKSTVTGALKGTAFFRDYVIGYNSKNHKLIALDSNCQEVKWREIQKLFEEDEMIITEDRNIITKDYLILSSGAVYDCWGNPVNKIYFDYTKNKTGETSKTTSEKNELVDDSTKRHPEWTNEELEKLFFEDLNTAWYQDIYHNLDLNQEYLAEIYARVVDKSFFEGSILSYYEIEDNPPFHYSFGYDDLVVTIYYDSENKIYGYDFSVSGF